MKLEFKENVGGIDAYIRTVGGVTFLSWGILKRFPIMILFGATLVAEGVIRWSPLFSVLSLTSTDNRIKFEESIEKFSMAKRHSAPNLR